MVADRQINMQQLSKLHCHVILIQCRIMTCMNTCNMELFATFALCGFWVFEPGAANGVSRMHLTAPPHLRDLLLAQAFHVLISCRGEIELGNSSVSLHQHIIASKWALKAPCKHFWIAHACFWHGSFCGISEREHDILCCEQMQRGLNIRKNPRNDSHLYHF